MTGEASDAADASGAGRSPAGELPAGGWSTNIRHLLEMIRFSHTLFALPFALLAAVIARHADATAVPPREGRWTDWLGIVLCMACARSAAMAFNRLVDRDVDAVNPRTAGRHLPAGTLSVPQVTAFAVVSGGLFVAATLLFLPNVLPLVLAVPVLLFLLGYSLTKRFTWLAHYWLGAALMLAPIAAWIALRGEVVAAHPADLLPAVVLGLGVFFWVGGFDVIYACQDADFDRSAGLHSIPARFGVRGALRLAAASHAVAVLAFAALAWVYPPLGTTYLLGTAAVAGLLIYEHRLVKADDLSRVNLAFFHVNTIISLGMLLVGIAALWR